MATSNRDPRSIVTPDALEVSSALYGLPLASPRRRAAALAIDGVVILLITALTNSFSLILGVVAGAFFIRAGFKRTPVRGSVFGRAMRFSVGCLGVVIALGTAGAWAVFGPDLGRGPSSGVEDPTEGLGFQLASGLAGLGLLDDLDLGDSREEAAEVAGDLIEAGRELGLDDTLLRGALVEALSPDVDWAEDWPSTVDALLEGQADGNDGAPDPTVVPDQELTNEGALRALADLLAQEDSVDEGYAAALRSRLVAVVASDSLGRLNRRISALDGEGAALRSELSSTREALEDAEGRGIAARIVDLADELGFGFGWAAVYMTLIMSWWNGQTVGKRLLGVRVVRLDGEPVTWWVAFERTGGYAAGLFTGLLGFAQVWWDANRQAIHDRIVGTVVVREGAEKVTNWEEAL